MAFAIHRSSVISRQGKSLEYGLNRTDGKNGEPYFQMVFLDSAFFQATHIYDQLSPIG
jgi:hypothetical protein